MNEPKNILITRTDRIGDVILSLPMASAIKKKYPGCRISFLVRSYTAQLLSGNAFVDETIVLIEANGKPDLQRNISLLKNKFDVVIAAYPTFKLTLIFFLAGINKRIGTGYRWYSFLFNGKVYDHRKKGGHHELEFNVRLLSQLGINNDVNETNAEFGLFVPPKQKEKIKNDMAGLGIDSAKKIIIIHPGSGGSAVDLPVSTLKNVMQILSKENVEILITGSTGEMEICSSLIVDEKTKNLAGRYDLSGLTALIERCDLMIANSTGPIHIAAALGKYVIGFYPKFTAASPERWGPYTEKKKIFTPELDCSNCSRKQCEELNCMSSIKAENIAGAALSILKLNVK